MRLIAFAGYTFSTGGYYAALADGANLGNFSLNPQVLPRRAVAGAYTGATVSGRPIPCTFGYDGTGSLTYEQAFQQLLGILDPANDRARTLTGQLNDGTTVQCQAIVTIPGGVGLGEGEVNTLEVSFFTTDPYWRKTTATTSSVTVTTNSAVAITNDGDARAYPTFTISATPGSRPSKTSTIGWGYLRVVQITNNTDRDWRDEPITFDLGDTAAWVSGGKAQADGDDVRVRYQGTEFPRTLTNFNTKRSFCHVVIPLLKAGATMTLDVWYGNASATAPLNLSTRTGTRDTYVAFDLEGVSGTATGGTASTLTASIGVVETDRWNNGFIQIVSGTGSGQRRRISDTAYAAGTTTFTVARNFTTTPDATSVFVVWNSGIAVDGGRASGAGTTTTLTDSSQSWATNCWAGGELWNVTKGIGPFTIASNTATVITTSDTMTAPALNDVYYIERQGVWQYVVDTVLTETAHRGLYRANKYYSKPSRLWYGDQVPGGWQPTTYLPNSDDYSQLRAYDTGSGGGHSANYWPLLRARRRKSQDARYKDEGNGDGLSIYSAFGFQTITFDYQYKNVNGVGKIVFACLEPGGEDWATFVEQTTTQASLTPVAAQNVDLSAYDNPTRIFMGVLPADEVAVASSAAETDEVEVRTDNTLTLWLDADAFGGLTNGVYAVGSESSIYDLNVALRLGGGEESVKAPPYDRALTGGSGHYLRLKSGESLVINCDPLTSQPFAAVYSGATLQYRAPWAVRVYRHEADIEGVDTALVSRDFMPIPARTNLLSNPTFATNLTGWGNQEDDAGVTATWSRDAGVFYDAAGSLKCVVSAAPGVGYFSKYMTTSTIAVVTGQTYDVAFAFRTTNTNLQGWMAVDDGVTEYDLGYYVAAATGTWYVGGFSFTAPASAITFRVGVYGAAGATGTIYFDALSLGQQNLYISETSMGSLTVATAFYPGWWG